MVITLTSSQQQDSWMISIGENHQRMPSEIEEEIKSYQEFLLTATQALQKRSSQSKKTRPQTTPFCGKRPSGLLQESRGTGSVHLELVLR